MDQHLTQLEAVLQSQIARHEQLAALTQAKLAALRQADHKLIAALTQQENQQLQAIAELEKQRLTLVAELTLLVAPTEAQPLRMGELAERLNEPARGRLLVLRAQLRQRMEAVRQQAALARGASEALLRHMSSLVQSIGSVLTGVAAYGRRGAPPRTASAVSTFCATA